MADQQDGKQGTYLDEVTKKKRSGPQMVETAIFGIAFLVVIGVGAWMTLGKVANEERWEPPVDPKKEATPAELIGYKNVAAWATDLETIWGVAVNDKGNRVYAVGKGGLRVYDNKGLSITSKEMDETVRTITLMEDGSYYLGIKGRVERYDDEHVLQATWDKLAYDEGESPEGDAKRSVNVTSIVITDEHAFIGDVGGREIIRTDLQGNVQKRFGSTKADQVNGVMVTGPHLDLAWHGDRLWVTNPGRHHVQAYDADGELHTVVGKQSARHIGFTGCCNPSSLTVLPDGRVITTEKGMPRVKLISPEDGSFITFIAAEDEWRKRGRKHAYAVDLAWDGQGHIYIADKKETGDQLVTVYAPADESEAPAPQATLASDQEDPTS